MPTGTSTLAYGATLRGNATDFRVWAPRARSVTLRFLGRSDHPMCREGDDFTLTLPATPGDRYFYIVDDGRPVPDPVSRLLPEGVHGPTEIIDPDEYHWHDAAWKGIDLRDYILYELHIGTFTPEGTFDAAIQRLPELKHLGITAIEIMPVASFPGKHNWGYDGVSPYAVQESYGGPVALKRLVDAAHAAGLAVLLDVVYNHLGNEGNYLRLFGPYFTDQHTTPWGEAINYDGPGSEGVRRYFIENALYWIREYHFDGLRLDAIQNIKDDSQPTVVAEIATQVRQLGRELGRPTYVIGETDKNDVRDLRPVAQRGQDLDAVWSDDFHHAIHTLLTDEREGYYQDFGRREQLVRALEEGFVFQGEHFDFWNEPRGTRPEGIPLWRHVICIQNHDQVGNRARGERLNHLVPRGARKLAAALLLLAPHTPLLFMGQEYDEEAHFQFFSDYGDPTLQRAVSEGRRKEFKDFTWDEVSDPQDPATFERSRLGGPQTEEQRDMLDWYRKLIELRKRLVIPGDRTCRAEWQGDTLVLQVPAERARVMVRAGFGGKPEENVGEHWKLMMSSDEEGFGVRMYQQL